MLEIRDPAVCKEGALVVSKTISVPVSYTHLDVYKRQVLPPSYLSSFNNVNEQPPPPAPVSLVEPTPKESLNDLTSSKPG